MKSAEQTPCSWEAGAQECSPHEDKGGDGEAPLGRRLVGIPASEGHHRCRNCRGNPFLDRVTEWSRGCVRLPVITAGSVTKDQQVRTVSPEPHRAVPKEE